MTFTECTGLSCSHPVRSSVVLHRRDVRHGDRVTTLVSTTFSLADRGPSSPLFDDLRQPIKLASSVVQFARYSERGGRWIEISGPSPRLISGVRLRIDAVVMIASPNGTQRSER